MNELSPWISLAIAAGALAFAIYGRYSDRHGKKLTDLESGIAGVANQLTAYRAANDMRIDRVEDRCTRAESDIAHLPNIESTHRMEMSIGKLEGEVHALVERIKPIGAMADRIQEALMERVVLK
jgi:hypothetical protein